MTETQQPQPEPAPVEPTPTPTPTPHDDNPLASGTVKAASLHAGVRDNHHVRRLQYAIGMSPIGTYLSRTTAAVKEALEAKGRDGDGTSLTVEDAQAVLGPNYTVT